jgi:hypothetical protein
LRRPLDCFPVISDLPVVRPGCAPRTAALLQAAVQAASATSSTAITSPLVLKGLNGLPAGETLGGLSLPLHMTKGQPANNSCFFEMGIEHGKFVVLHGGTTICAPLVKAGTQPSS